MDFLDRPPPVVEFYGCTFVLTGVFALGTRSEIRAGIEHRGGVVDRDPTEGTDYVVVGAMPNPRWKHGSYGNRIERAIQLRDGGRSTLAIITEAHLVEAIQRTPKEADLS